MTPREPTSIERLLPMLLLVLIFALGAATLRPFLAAILWGTFLSISLQPAHARLTARLGGHRAPATGLIGLALVVLMLLPIVGLSRALIAFLPEAITWLTQIGVETPAMPTELPSRLTDLWTELSRDIDFLRERFGDDLSDAALVLMREGRLFGAFVLEFVLGILLCMMLLQKTSPITAGLIAMFDRLGGDFAHRLGHDAVMTIRYTMLGVLGSSAAQTLVAGFAYWLVGAPQWQLLSLCTFLLAMIQIGPVLIWVPLAVWLWVTGAAGWAIFLVIWGTVVVGLTDNVVKALVVSRGTNVPASLAFLGALGGLVVWGIVGIFVGPVILAICYRLLLTWLPATGSGPDAPA